MSRFRTENKSHQQNHAKKKERTNFAFENRPVVHGSARSG